jgi:hypothetical protein
MRTSRIAGLCYLVTFAAGTAALVVRVGPIAATMGAIAAASYIAVTVLLYVVFKPVNQTMSLIAAIVSLAGIAAGVARVVPFSTLVFFGVYCLMLAYLLFRSTSAPRALAPLMAFAGLGWLTFASPVLAHMLSPYNFAPGMIGEGALTIWLLSAPRLEPASTTGSAPLRGLSV